MTKQVNFLLPYTDPQQVESFVKQACKAYIRQAVILGVPEQHILRAWEAHTDQIADWVFHSMTTGEFYSDAEEEAISIGIKVAKKVARQQAVA